MRKMLPAAVAYALVPALLAGLVAACPALATGDPLQARGRDGDFVLAEPASGALRTPDGSLVDLELPAGARIEALAAAGARWWAAGSFADVGGVRRLVVVEGDSGRQRRLRAPRRAPGQAARGPVLFVEDGSLAGLAWLEGGSHRSLAVKAARWTGVEWESTEVVSPPGPGSQLALTGAVLADGTWLLAWSAFDGGDDEIRWSRRTAAGWSPPVRISPDNEVPDVTPALVAAGDGALVAWSRYDGNDYRLRVARFDGDGWIEERVEGPPGSLYPSFASDGVRQHLVYYRALPRGWSVAELDETGRIAARAAIDAEESDRPLVRFEGRTAIFGWPGSGGEGARLEAPLEAVP